ncbi:unnamed protein product, partial [Mycena citricolor]
TGCLDLTTTMAAVAENSTKRRNPPSFQHLPSNRAKKLKQAWVTNAKIKSQWKAEQRRSGSRVAKDVKHSESRVGSEDDAGDNRVHSADEATVTKLGMAEQHPKIPKPAKYGRSSNSRSQSQGESSRRTEQSHPSSQPTSRDLAREAYSPASLHTYRSDPLGKRQRGGSSIGRGRGHGRGQPDMKKRMNVLLETIKRDYA